jgi:transmembrane sensor
MNNYNNFNVLDWVNNREFQMWVFHGQAEDAWQDLFKKIPDQHANIEEARILLKKIAGDGEKISIQEVKLRVAEILKQVEVDENQKLNFQVASMVLLTIGLGISGVYWKQLVKQQEVVSLFDDPQITTQVKEIENSSNGEKTVNLPDGSTVILKKNAKIIFPRQFDVDKRVVFMIGEAFFEVRKNPQIPFYVYTNGMVAKVMGTSFSIQATEHEEEVKLLVKSGVVAVYQRASKHPLKATENTQVLENQLLTLNRHTGETQIQKAKNSPLLDMAVESASFSFERTPLVTVFEVLEKNYGIVIEYNRDKIAHCSITANLGDEPIYKKMEMICAVMNGKFQAKGDTIRVFSYGCKAL